MTLGGSNVKEVPAEFETWIMCVPELADEEAAELVDVVVSAFAAAAAVVVVGGLP